MRAGRPGIPRSLVLAILVALAGALTARPAGANGTGEVPWVSQLRAVNAALAQMDVAAAERVWQEAYLAALGSWRWDGVLEVGRAYLRIGKAAGRGETSIARARNLYLAALFRAREQRSLEGLLRTAEAFAQLGDRGVVEQCFQIATSVAAETRDPHAPARIRAWAIQLGDPSLAPPDTRR